MKVKLFKTLTAITAAIAAIVLCLMFPQIIGAKAGTSYYISLESGYATGNGSAVAAEGDTCFTYVTVPSNDSYDLLAYYAMYYKSGSYYFDLIADGGGSFYPNVGGFTDGSGRLLAQSAALGFYPIWYKYTSGSGGSSIDIRDPWQMLPSVSYEWYDSEGLATGESGSGNICETGYLITNSTAPDARCGITLTGTTNFARFTLPVIESYSISYDLSGGTLTDGYALVNSYFSESVTLPTADDISRTGHTFDGWYEDADFTGEAVTELNEGSTGNKMYYAKWTACRYSVSLCAGAGSLAENLTAYTYGVGAELPPATQTGYIFGGWYDSESLSGDAVTAILPDDTGDKIFYAKWTAATYKIYYETNGGSINSGQIDEYTYGDVILLPTNVTRNGYKFIGWLIGGEQVTSIKSTDTGDKTFYAEWELVGYGIMYITNGGEIIGEYATAYSYGDSITLPANVTRTGYTFGGWFDNENFSGHAITAISPDDTGGKICYAKWTAAVYKIYYETSGGTINSGQIDEYTYGNAVILPTDVTRTGYKFLGWHIGGGQVTKINSNDTGDKTFYADWELIKYCVTYIGGDIVGDYATTYSYGDSMILPANVQRIGHIFGGWFDNESYSGDAVVKISSKETGDKTYYAKWTLATYKIYYETSGGVINSGQIDEYTYGDVITLPTDVTRTGYKFIGWYIDGYAVTSISANDIGDKIFSADWELIKYSITYIDGNIIGDYATTYSYGDSIVLPTNVQKAGYVFEGWYLTAEKAGDRIYIISSFDYGDKTFYALFTAENYTIVYETYGGTIDAGGVYKYTFGACAELPTDVTREGFTFIGWYTDAGYSGSRVTSVSSDSIGDCTYYAKWEIIYSAGTIGNYSGTYDGETRELSFSVTAPDTVTYQWYFNGRAIAGATANVYCFTDVSDSGAYYCVAVITAAGADSAIVTSNTAFVDIRPKTYQIILVDGVGYTLSASAESAEHGGSCEIYFTLKEGYLGDIITVNGKQYKSVGGRVTISGVAEDLTVSVTNIKLDPKYVSITDGDGDYNGKEFSASAVMLINGEFEFNWYLGGMLIYSSKGQSSALSFTAAGFYELTLVISVYGQPLVDCLLPATVTIRKADMSQPVAMFDNETGIISLISGAAGTRYRYLENGEWTDLAGNMLEAATNGTYTFRAVGDSNHNDSGEFSVTICSVSFTLDGQVITTILAEKGSVIETDVTAEKKSSGNIIYKFIGWTLGGSWWYGTVNGDIILSASFTEHYKTVEGGNGLSVTGDGGFAEGAVITEAEADAESIAALASEGKGVLLFSVDISVTGAAEDGLFTVTYTLPAELWGKSIAVYHYRSDGVVEKLYSQINGISITFVTTGFSPFGFFDVTQFAARGTDADGNAYYLGSYIRGDTVHFSAVAHPAEEGFTYIFDGWFLDADYTERVSALTVSGDILLYAKFIKSAVAVYYNVTATDEYGNVYYVGTYACGSTVDLAGFKASRAEYTYEGLSVSSDCTELITSVYIDGNISLFIKFSSSLPNNESNAELPMYALVGVHGDAGYMLGSYEEGTSISLLLFTLPSYSKDGSTYLFEGWYLDESYSKRADVITFSGDTKLYARFILAPAPESAADGDDHAFIITVCAGAATAVLLMIIIAVVLILRRGKRSLPAPVYAAAPLPSYSKARAEQEYLRLKEELDNADNYLLLSPDKNKARTAAKAKEILREYEYVMNGISASSDPRETSYAEDSLDRLSYELRALLGEIYG